MVFFSISEEQTKNLCFFEFAEVYKNRILELQNIQILQEKKAFLIERLMNEVVNEIQNNQFTFLLRSVWPTVYNNALDQWFKDFFSLNFNENLQTIERAILKDQQEKAFKVQRQQSFNDNELNRQSSYNNELIRQQSYTNNDYKRQQSLKTADEIQAKQNITENPQQSLRPSDPLPVYANYYLKNVAHNEFVFVALDKLSGDNMVEGRKGIQSRCGFHLTKDNNGYLLRNIEYNLYLFLADQDRMGGDRVLEAGPTVTPKSYFDIIHTAKGFVILNKKHKEYLFLSGDYMLGDRVMEGKKNIDDKSYFEFISF